ncbi:hypothetical protein DERF_008588 [Dermatophagoides farinae]|uniref:Uncharacterized protein n=1 Tax=Dermatophagoides farinae TaxID=6954 RepID=A0A922I3J7_DERFA|nr:hypothetical protein DERF_008588 [Dermatophagoides farinae]
MDPDGYYIPVIPKKKEILNRMLPLIQQGKARGRRGQYFSSNVTCKFRYHEDNVVAIIFEQVITQRTTFVFFKFSK